MDIALEFHTSHLGTFLRGKEWNPVVKRLQNLNLWKRDAQFSTVLNTTHVFVCSQKVSHRRRVVSAPTRSKQRYSSERWLRQSRTCVVECCWCSNDMNEWYNVRKNRSVHDRCVFVIITYHFSYTRSNARSRTCWFVWFLSTSFS